MLFNIQAPTIGGSPKGPNIRLLWTMELGIWNYAPEDH